MNACMAPTKSSIPRNGTRPTSGTKNAIAINNTSPAKTFPKSLNVKLINLASSLIASRIPTKNPVGPSLKLMNFPACPQPNVENPQKWTPPVVHRN